MSLVELTVAMAVMMLVVGIVMGLMMELSKNWRRMSDYWMVMRPAQQVLERVCADLEEVRPYDLDMDQLLAFEFNEEGNVFDQVINGHTLHFYIVPMSRQGRRITKGESPDWLDVQMEIRSNKQPLSSNNQTNAVYTLRRRVIVQARL